MKNVVTRISRLAAMPFIMAAGIPAAAWAQQYSPYYGHMGDGPYGRMWDSPWHGWFLGPLMMILFVAVIVGVVVLLVRWLGGGGHGHVVHTPPGRVPLDILKERFARGEIDKEEFEERRRVLGE